MTFGIAAGYTRRETLLTAPGEVYDMFELYLQRNGYKKKEADKWQKM